MASLLIDQNPSLSSKKNLIKKIFAPLHQGELSKGLRGFKNKSFLTYLILASLLIISTGIGYTLYRQAINRAKTNLAYSTASSPVYANRILSFQGRLTDSSGNPITAETGILFELYNTPDVGTGTTLYTSASGNSQTVTFDNEENGIFSVTIGQSHGTTIPASVFTENSAVYLQITAGGETMSPRQPIATVAYAINAETLQGLPPSASGLKDTVLVIDGSGNLNLGESNPAIIASSTAPNSIFRIEGQAVLIKATDTYGGNIEINPDANGIIKLTTEGSGSTAINGFIDATNANLSTGNLYSATIGNNNRGYNFLNFSNFDSGIGNTQLSTRFSVDASGNTFIGGTLNPTNISIGNTILTSSAAELNYLDGTLVTAGSLIYGNGSNLSNTDVGTSGQILMSNASGAPVWINASSTGIGTTYGATNGLSLISGNFGLGGTLTQNTSIGNSSFSLSFLGLGNTQGLFLASSGNVGIGTTNPTEKFVVSVPTYGDKSFSVYDGYYNYNIGSGSNTTGGYRLSIYKSANEAYFNNAGTNYGGFHFLSDGNDRLTIKSAGFIGIGITNPLYSLQVGGSGTALIGTKLGVGATGSAAFNVSTDASIGTTLTTGTLLVNNTAIGGSNIVAFSSGTSGLVGYLDTTSWDKNASNDYASWNLQANGAGTTAILSGNTVNFVNGVGISLSQTGSSITINNTGIGTTYAATNGLTLTSGNFGLGGTLTQNTQIGTSSFSLSFLGLGNTQGLYLASSGNVGIGTTNPLYTLDVSGKIALDGTQALYIPTNFYGNLIVGDGGTHLTHTTDLEGWYNTFVGIGVGMSNTTGYYNSAIGSYALYNNTTGNSNTANGASSLFSNTTGSYNTAFGAIALYNNTEGSYNTAIGHIALTNNTTGSDNFGLGDQALYNNTTGNYNIAIGSLAQNNTTDGSENISIGRASLYGNTTGTNNIALGLISGRYLADGSTANTTADYSMYLGIRSRSLASNSQNEIVIGSYAIGNGSNSVTIGSTAVTKTILQGNIGLGTTNPTYKLEIGGTGSAYVGGNLTVGSIGATTDNNQVLTSTGGLIQYLDTSSWDKTSSDDFQNWVLASGSTSAIIGTGNTVTFVEGVGISLVQTGNTITITNTGLGTTYTASAGITLVANDFRLNLGSSNVFTALQSFTGGIGVSGNTNLTNNLTIGGTFVSVGSTNLVTNLNADLLDGNHATAFVGVGATGNFITTITGGVGISLFGSGIGRTVNIASPTCTGTDKLQWNGSAFICSADVGATYSASVGITLVGNDIRLHLGYAPTWTGLHTFSSGATISNLSVGGTFVSVGSTNTVTNLSSDYLDGYNSTYFVNIGQTGNFLTTLNLQAGTSMTITGTGVGTTISHSDTSTQASSDNSNGVVIQDISLDGLGHLTGLATVDLDSRYLQIGNTGSLPYVNNATNGTLTRSGTGPFTLALNLGATNTWTGLQTFNLGATNASFAVGSTVMITSLNADLLDGLHSSSFMQVGSTGFLTTATNGLMAIGSTAVGLGGTLTQNTSIGNSSFSLSFLGLGNTQGLFLASSGNVGIGTTSPTQKFDVAGKIALNGTQALYIPTNFSETLIVGDGGTHLTHSTDAEGWYNTFVGIGVGYSNTTGYMNTGLGDWALYSNKTGNNNTSIGAATLWQSTGSENTAIGTASLYSNTTGGANSAFGTYSMGSNTEGTDNVAMGYFSLFGNTTGTRNSAIGVYTLGSNVDGSYNSALGSDAGVYLSTGSTITSPDYGLYLGYNTRSLVNNAQNEVVIGANAVGNGSNSVMIGSTTVTKTTINGNLGLGTTNPTSKLHVVGNGYFSTSLSIGTSLNVVGNTSIGGTLAVTGRSTFAQNVFVNAGGIGVTGVSVFSTGATIASLSVSSIGSTTDNNQVLTSTGGLIQYIDTTNWDKSTANDYASWNLQSNGAGTTAIGTGTTVNFVNGVGISLSQTGSSITINNTGIGTTYAAGNGLTLSSGVFKLGGELTEATRLNIGSTEVLYLSTAGNVGIGITNPIYKFQVGGTNSLVAGDRTTGTSSGATIIKGATIKIDANYGTYTKYAPEGLSLNNAGTIKWYSDGDLNTGAASYDVGLARLSTNKLLVTDGATGYGTLAVGNLGIGITNPLYALHVGGTGSAYVGGNLTIGGTFVSVGSTNLVTSLNADLLDGYHASSFLQVGYTGFFNTATNGLMAIGNTAVGLGGTLTQNTSIGTSSFNLSFVGLGGTQSLYLASSGKVGIGTTAPRSTLDVNGLIYAAGGSNSAPGYSFGNDTDTGFFSDTSGSWGIATDGNISVKGDSAGIMVADGWEVAPSYSFDNSSSMGFFMAEQDVLGIATSGIERVRINSTGNLGLGTTNPLSKLSVVGNANISTSLSIGTSLSVGSIGVTTDNNQVLTSTGGLIQYLDTSAWDKNASNDFQNWVLSSSNVNTTIGTGNTVTFVNGVGISLSQTGSSITINNTGTGTTYAAGNGLTLSSGTFKLGGELTEATRLYIGSTEVLYLSATGDVGIGITSPGAKLQINPDITTKIGLLVKGFPSQSANLQEWQRSDGTVLALLDKNGSFVSYSSILSYHFYAPNETSHMYFDSAGGIRFTTGPWNDQVNRLSIGASGNVGIGTTNPLYTLHVAGTGVALIGTKLGVGATSVSAFNVSTDASIGTTLTTGSLIVNNTAIGGSNIVAFSSGTSGLVGYLDTTAWDKNASNDYASWNLQTNSAGTTAIGTGTTVNFVNGVGISLSQTGSSITINSTGTGTTYAATNGLTLTSGNFGLGGTLTQNTSIGNSSFSLSFLGLGNTQGLFLASSGNVGIGTTSPTQKLDVSGKIALNGTQALYIPTNFTETLIVGDGGTHLTHTTDAEGWYNTFVGIGVGYSNTTGYDNTGVGDWALYSNKTGNDNTAIGAGALVANTGSQNTALGSLSLYSNTSGNQNTANGTYSLFSNTTGNLNTSVGYYSLVLNTTGYDNTAVGAATLSENTTGHTNSAVGNGALYYNETGSYNVVLGTEALSRNQTGNYNTAIGYNAGRFTSAGASNATSDYSFYLGADARSLADNDQNEIVIGNYAIGNGSNTISIGSTANVKTIMFGNMGIGTTNPLYTLHVGGSGTALIGTKLGVGATSTSAFNVSTDANIGTTLTTGSLLVNNTAIGGSNIIAFSSGTSGLVGYLDTTAWDKNASNDYASWMLQANSAGTTAIGTGTTVNFVNGVGISLSQTGSSITINSTGTGTTYAATNGLTLTSGNFGLGGTLTQNTSIGNSSFSLSFLGLGNTQGLFLASSGNVGIGTTNPTAKLVVVGDGSSGSPDLTLLNNDGSINFEIRTSLTELNNILIGNNSGKSITSGQRNIAIGKYSLYTNQTGSGNFAIGQEALYYNTASDNSAIGYMTLHENINGTNNAAQGQVAMYSNTSGSNNSGFGHSVLKANTSGSYNSAFGVDAGRYLGDGSTGNTTPDYGLYLGYSSRSLVDNSQNEIVIGSYAIGNGSNSVSIGSTAVTKTILQGNLGLGTTNPVQKLSVIGNGSFSTSLTVGTTLTTPTLVVNSTAAVGGSNVAAFSTGTSGLVGYLSTAGWDKSTADDYASWMLQANSAGTTAIGTGTTVNFVNGVGISLSQTGSSITINSTAGTYTASTGITLVTNDFRLNLGYNPTWTALHTFSGGATISSLSVTNNASIGATLTTPTLLVNNTAIGGSNVAAFSTGTSGLVGYLDTTAWDKLASDDLTTSSNLLMVKGDSGTAENIAVGNTISFVGGAGLGSTVSATDTITFNIGASAGINVAADTIGVNAGAGLTFSGTQLILNLGSTNVWTALQTFTNGIGVSGTAAFTNNVTIGNSLTVTQLTTLTAGFTANATSYVSSLGIGTSLNVVGNASIGGTLAVTGKSVFTAGFDSNGASIITNLTLDGNSGTALAISGTSFTTDITLQNNATIDNDVSGRINFGSGATIPYLSQNGTTFLTSTQLFQAGDGAVGTPAYSFTNDTNSGIYSGGADILNIGTSGLFRLTILANGRIGIGTTTPTAKLTVDGSIKGDNLILTGNNTLIGFAGFIPYFNTSGGLGTGGIQRLTSTGNLTNIGSIQAGQLNISSGGTFSTGITYPTIASGPYSVTSADLNGDGQPDLVSADGGTENAITVFINNGDGTFATGTTYPTIATTPFSVTSADLNSDGYSDLITANNGTPDSITVFINNGNGTFGVGTTYPSRGTNPYTVITTDLNGDGQVDLVTNNYGSNNINVFTNNGDGTFNAGTTYPTIAAGPYSVTSGDLNGDDNPDLITANYTANNITVFNNNGDGTFAAGITYPTIATNPTSITSRDLDRDGYPDLITANNGTPDSITIFNNNGDGTLGVGTTYLTKGANPYSVTSADLNGDGQPDLATANGTGNNITVFTNNNDGTFSTGTTYPTIGRGPRSVIPVDLNSDGLSDLVSANNTDNNITVFFNNPTTTLYTASSGYVGIGTTNPTAKLSIVGNDGLLASFDTINAGTTEQAFIDFNGARAQVGYDGKRARAFLAGTSGKGLELLVNGGVGGTNYTAALNINTNGFVGIGTTSPKYLLEVIGANTSGVAYIKNTTSTTMPTLTINTSSTNTGTTGAEFIRFVNAAGNSIGRIRQAGSTLAITIGTSAAGDFAEYVRGDEPTEETDLIAFHGDKFGKAREGETIAGTHSNFATFVGNEGLASEPNSFPLALIGIVEVKVSSDHGSINPGDPLAISNIPGVAAKATKAGLIVGRAMESYSNNDPNVIGKIRIIVNTIYYDPDIQLTATGQININYNVSPEVLASLGYDGTKNEIESATYSLTDSLGATVTRISQFSEIATAKIKAGLISAKNIIADNIVTKKLISQKIETDNIISPLGNIDHLTTTDIQTSQITTDNLIAQNIQVTEMVVEDIIAENIISENLETEKLTSDQLTSREATVSTLYADQIISKDGSFGDLMAAKISSLRDELKSIVAANTEESTPSAILSSSKDWSITVATDSATIKGNLSLTDSLIIGAQLMVNGDSQFKNAFVSGDFTAGEIALSGNSISTLNTALYIQPTNTGSVHIMGETLVIAESGQVNITGDLTITGSLFGNLIQAAEIETQKLTAAEINSNRINIATDSASLIIASESEENVATNSAQLTSNATAGTATLPIGKTEIIINSDKLTPNSMVYLTPMGSTNNQVIYVKDKSESNFTISLDNSLDHDINVNWWIIN